MSDDLVKSLEWSCRDPVTHESIDDGDYSNATVSEVKQAIAEITRLRAEQGKVRGYLSRLLQALHPNIDLLPDPLGVCTQIDNVLGGQKEEITRLRAAINDALTAPWPDPELNSTWHQEPIGPNETPEEAIKRLVRVRAEWREER